MLGTIYSVMCKVSGKRYIGQTVRNVDERWREHISESRKNTDLNHFHRAIAKYNPGMFVVRTLEEKIPLEKLNERERYWIEQFDTFTNGYNSTSGGENGKIITEDVKEKIANKVRGITKSDESIRQISNTLKKNNHTFTVPGSGKHLRCKIRGTHVNTGEVVEYNSMKEAEELGGFPCGNLSRGIKKGYVVGGYKWEKIEDKSKNFPVWGKRILDGKVIHHFNSMREAGRVLGTGDTTTLFRALKNPSRYSWKGCRWYYQPPE